MLRPDGTVFAVGSKGYTSIYDTHTGTWHAGPRLPLSPQGNQYTAQDSPAALLPDGNVLIAVTGGAAQGGYSGPPVAFFEFDGNRLIPEPTVPHASIDVSGSINLLVLPTGQVLATDSTKDVEIYTPGNHDGPRREWRPEIDSVPTTLQRGHSYSLSGIRLNGMSQASSFGDEGQNATNYPLLRITSLRPWSVRYMRTHDFSSMAVASDALSTLQFDIPSDQPTGYSYLQVVTNGIASQPITVHVTP
jgi:hypothetical protein